MNHSVEVVAVPAVMSRIEKFPAENALAIEKMTADVHSYLEQAAKSFNATADDVFGSAQSEAIRLEEQAEHDQAAHLADVLDALNDANASAEDLVRAAGMDADTQNATLGELFRGIEEAIDSGEGALD